MCLCVCVLLLGECLTQKGSWQLGQTTCHWLIVPANRIYPQTARQAASTPRMQLGMYENYLARKSNPIVFSDARTEEQKMIGQLEKSSGTLLMLATQGIAPLWDAPGGRTAGFLSRTQQTFTKSQSIPCIANCCFFLSFFFLSSSFSPSMS